MKPSPDEDRAAFYAPVLADLAALCAHHGVCLEWRPVLWEDGYQSAVVLRRIRPGEEAWLQGDATGALVMFHDGEVRFEPELRDPEDVLAQVPIPTTAHQKLYAARRLSDIRNQP